MKDYQDLIEWSAKNMATKKSENWIVRESNIEYFKMVCLEKNIVLAIIN